MRKIFLFSVLLCLTSCLDLDGNKQERPSYNLNPDLEGKWQLKRVGHRFTTIELNDNDNFWSFNTVDRSISIENNISGYVYGLASVPYQSQDVSYSIENGDEFTFQYSYTSTGGLTNQYTIKVG